MKQKIFIPVPAASSPYKTVTYTESQILVPISDAFYKNVVKDHAFIDPKFLILWGAYGSGKTKTAVLIEVINGLFSPVRLTGLITRKTKASIRHSLYQEMKSCVEKLGLSKWCKFKDSEGEIENIATGTRYISRGMDYEPEKIKGIEGLTRIIADEISEYTIEELGMLTTRLRAEIGKKTSFIGMFNPTARALHIKEFMENLQSNHDENEFKEMYSYYIHNDFIDKADYLKTLEITKLFNESEYLMAIGKIKWAEVQNKNPFFPQFEIKYHVTQGLEYNRNFPLYFFLDFNVGEYACIIVQSSFVDRGKDAFFHVIDEICLTKDDVRGKGHTLDVEMGNRIRQYVERLGTADFYIGGDQTAMNDSTKGITGHTLANTVFNGRANWKRLLFGNAKDEYGVLINPNAQRANLEHGQSYQLCNAAFMYHPNIKIDAKCTHTIRDISYARQDDKDLQRNKVTLFKVGGAGVEAQNFTDAFRYSMHYILSSYLKK